MSVANNISPSFNLYVNTDTTRPYSLLKMMTTANKLQKKKKEAQ